MARPLTLLESAILLGRYRYLELQAFSLLGLRAQSARNALLASLLASLSRAHAHRAAEIEARLPVSVGLPSVPELTEAPSEDLDAALEDLVSLDDEELLDALAVLYQELETGYQRHHQRCSPYADPHIERLLGRLLADVAARAGEVEAVGARLDWPAKRPRALGRITRGLRSSFAPLPANRPPTVVESSP